MTDLGYIALVLAFLLSLYGIVVSVVGARRGRSELINSGRNSVYVVSGLILFAGLLMWRALLTNEFQVEFVASHSERALPTLFKISALWGGQAGSILFWSMLASLMAVSATFSFRKQASSLMPWVNMVLLIYLGFFMSLLLFAENPFARLWQLPTGQSVTAVFQPAGATALIPTDGQGLNPQLQNYWMVVHPVALYLGFVGMTVPFAFAVAALITGQLGNTWIKLIRRWTLVPWVFLTIGILLGSQWAYVELGLGRLLGLGRGRECLVPAVAHRHRVRPQHHDPGASRHAQGLEHGADRADLRADPDRHVPHPLGRRAIGPLVRPVRGRTDVRRVHHR